MTVPGRSLLAGFASCLLFSHAAPADPPQYQIQDLGVLQTGDTASEALGISTGGVVVGRSLRSGGSQAFAWTSTTGLIGLPNLSGRSYCLAKAALDDGSVVGSCATTASGTDRVPVVWRNGAVLQLALPPMQTTGEPNVISRFGEIVGSVNSGSLERAAGFSTAGSSVLTGTTSNGSYFVSALATNESLLVFGRGADPNNPMRNVAIVYSLQTAFAGEIPPLPGMNGAIAYGATSNGFVVGASMLNQGPGLAFIRSSGGEVRAIPLPSGATQGTARAVNTAGWTVGTAASTTSVPFLYDGMVTYRLIDLIPSGSGWDLSTTESAATGISNGGIIAGTGVHNGVVRAFAMLPASGVPSLCDICHKGRTTAVPCGSDERRRHLTHGDLLGACAP